ncbi:ATP-binding cassette domain-containing protein (plasmid) [Ensifer adhaerens]|uniref:ABC transporter ATP-binding protein/permease n=1 Tax=Ensifer adhaerens TaxID=106592 RepID=UPI0023A97D2B|nr:ATP-binding cassette domain-containing protein [Ensifer adhaerens]WDZ81908.1 ATP-binding cassette domain-containing protein [Ensifer adhaerens]
MSDVVRSNAQRATALVKWPSGGKRRRPRSPVSSMRSFWGLLLAYWLSERWREAWSLTFLILLLTGLSAQASVWFALTSGELVNRIANFHHPTVPTSPSSLLSTAATLAAIAITRDAGFTAVRHFFSTTLHRKWRQWLDERFNQALLDSNHTHFHLQQNGFGASSETESSSPDNIDQRVQEAIKGMTGGAIGLGVGIAGVVLSLGFVGGKLIETSSSVRGLDFLGSYGSACLTLLAIAIYVPLNTFIAARLGGILQGLSLRIQSAEGSYRSELNQLLHRSFHVAVIRGEPAQKTLHGRRYRDIDQTWASLNRVTAGYMGFELVHNFIGSRIVAYAPGLLPYVDKTISLQEYVTGAELATALINECSWFIHAMPDIATLRADARRITELAQAIETVQRPQDYYARSGPSAFEYATQDGARGLSIQSVELLHTGDDKPFLSVEKLDFAPGEWTLMIGESGSGKTSLLKAINGLWAHGRGLIATPDTVRTLFAAQDVKLQGVCLKDLVCLPDEAAVHGDAAVVSALEEAGLEEFAGELSSEGREGQHWDKLLSGGEKQKLVLAKILLLKPGLIFLDEATSALDGQAVQAFHKSIKEHCPQATVVAIMHDISSIQSEGGADVFDSVLVIETGVADKKPIADWRKARGNDT